LIQNVQKRCTRLTVASDKVYQLLAHGRWFSPGTPASSTTKTGRHDIAEILLKVALSTSKSINQIKMYICILLCFYYFFYYRTMGFGDDLQGKDSHTVLVRCHDTEIRLYENIKRCLSIRIDSDKKYATYLTSFVQQAQKVDFSEFSPTCTVMQVFISYILFIQLILPMQSPLVSSHLY
jgi:hypothetical protein